MKHRKRLKRYHRDIFFPDWTEVSVKRFIDGILSGKSITYSLHATEKLIDYSILFGKTVLLKALRQVPLELGNIFEFYAVGEEIKKACFRFSFDEIPVDLTLVISTDGVVITLYVSNKGDNHTTLDKKLYERSNKE